MPITGGQQLMQKEQRKRGRPVVQKMPELIPDTPENIARAVLASPKTPKDGWKYLKEENDRGTMMSDEINERRYVAS